MATRINGTMMQKFHGKRVCLFANVTNKSDGLGSAIQAKTLDDQQITIRFKEPLKESIYGLVEVVGTAQGKGLILADTYVVFPEEIGSTFDANLHTETIRQLHSLGTDNPWDSENN